MERCPSQCCAGIYSLHTRCKRNTFVKDPNFSRAAPSLKRLKKKWKPSSFDSWARNRREAECTVVCFYRTVRPRPLSIASSPRGIMVWRNGIHLDDVWGRQKQTLLWSSVSRSGLVPAFVVCPVRSSVWEFFHVSPFAVFPCSEETLSVS